MSDEWNPADYKDEFRERLRKVIEKRLKSHGVVTTDTEDEDVPENATTNVVDFMALLQKSLADHKRTPARKGEAKTSDKSESKPGSKASKAKAKTPRKTPARKTTTRVTRKKTG